jgi:hypothetical protein
MPTSPNTVTLPVSLTVENLLQVIATLSEQIRRLESERDAGCQAEIPPHIVAVISAAVHATAGSRARIVKMAPVAENLSWSSEGRRAIFHSHAVR